VDKSVNTSAAHFARLSPCAKTQNVMLTPFFVAQTVTIGEQKISPRIFFKGFLPTPTTPGQAPSDYADLVVVAVLKISSKCVGITRSLATRRTLGIPKLLNCINKAQPERSRRHVIKNTAPEPEPIHFYKSSAALVLSLQSHCESFVYQQ